LNKFWEVLPLSPTFSHLYKNKEFNINVKWFFSFFSIFFWTGFWFVWKIA
jgi:hypothetical protein